MTDDKIEEYKIKDPKVLKDITVISENLTKKHSKVINETNPWYSGYNLTLDIILNRVEEWMVKIFLKPFEQNYFT